MATPPQPHLPKQDNWSSQAYQNAASFVPRLATRVVGWLGLGESDGDGDVVLDLGCGDGVLTHQLAAAITTGSIHGIDSSPSMISTANATRTSARCTFSILDATQLISTPALQAEAFTKVFSNAALHWILRDPETRRDVFRGIHRALRPQGIFCAEMGGFGNVGEMHAALIAASARRIGLEKAREADPWFFPDVEWMKAILASTGFHVEKIETEYRPTRAEEGQGGGVEGWVRLMGKAFLDAVEAEKGPAEREECVKEVVEVLRSICESPTGGAWIGYVRLRVLARKV